MWFIVLVAYVHGRPLDGLTQSVAGFRYPTEAACLQDALPRAEALARVGAHGGYLCTYHNEPGARLARAVKVRF